MIFADIEGLKVQFPPEEILSNFQHYERGLKIAGSHDYRLQQFIAIRVKVFIEFMIKYVINGVIKAISSYVLSKPF